MMQNNRTPIILDRISQSAIQSGYMSDNPELRLNAMINDYSFRISTLEGQVNTIDQSVAIIKSNYLTTPKFYLLCVIGLATIFGAGATTYFNLDNKFEARFTKIDERFEKVETNIHTLDIRLVKVEQKLEVVGQRLDDVDQQLDKVGQRLSVVEKKIDNIDDKLDLLLQQKTQANR